ncbi:hypothetical protein BGZ74_005027 [Mortierella antarctica]|nr:hypothetical protein BGZ74_005027 [Mortierella antarctica]
MLLIKPLLVLCSAAAVMAQGQADDVVSAALFFGDDTTDASDAVDVFRRPNNHSTATASILVYSAEQTGSLPDETLLNPSPKSMTPL